MNVKKVLELPNELTPNCIYLVQNKDFVSIFISSVDGKTAKKVLNIDDVKELIKSLNPDSSDIIQFKDDLELLKTEQENILLLLDSIKKLDISYLEQIKNIISEIQNEISRKIEENIIEELNIKIDNIKNLVDSIDFDYLISLEGIITTYGLELSNKVSFSDINIIITQINNINQILEGKVDYNIFEDFKNKFESIDFSFIESYEQNLALIVETLNDKVNIQSFNDLQQKINDIQSFLDQSTIQKSKIVKAKSDINNSIKVEEKDDAFELYSEKVTSKPLQHVQPKLVNSIPLYTLDNNGDYVLCKPDVWLDVNGYYIPAYLKETLNLE